MIALRAYRTTLRGREHSITMSRSVLMILITDFGKPVLCMLCSALLLLRKSGLPF